tara:strand:+ start:80 stop:481 length:402 start_codon:yes stop_codon:yes gene_type:complete
LKFLTLYGKEKPLRSPHKYKIKWNGKCRSKFQAEVRKYIYKYWKYDAVYEEFRVIGTQLSLDFYNHTKKIAIEVQGAQHLKFVKHFHKTRANFVRQLRRDDKKIDFCEMNSIELLLIYPEDELSEEYFANLLG